MVRTLSSADEIRMILMIAPAHNTPLDALDNEQPPAPEFILLARYGRVPQVARFAGHGPRPSRGTAVVVRTDRGEEIAETLQLIERSSGVTAAGDTVAVTSAAERPVLTGELLRLATRDDQARAAADAVELESAFPQWLRRASEWQLQLELIDLERTLDGRLILYVLNDRNAETTRLALLAAAAGHGVVHVQPVSAEGILQVNSGGCGTGGCGSGGCGTGH
jgi:hypothetical protein